MKAFDTLLMRNASIHSCIFAKKLFAFPSEISFVINNKGGIIKLNMLAVYQNLKTQKISYENSTKNKVQYNF